jgi:hypothetical protein
MKPTQGQICILKKYGLYNEEKSHIIAEAGVDRVTTFYGSWMANNKGSKKYFRFENEELIKTINSRT